MAGVSSREACCEAQPQLHFVHEYHSTSFSFTETGAVQANAQEMLVFGPGRHANKTASGTSIQVWLGAAAGWSSAVCMYESRQQVCNHPSPGVLT